MKPYVDVENLDISTENTDWKGRKYKADYVELDKKHDVGFEVTDRSIIVFCFTAHQHFDNYTTDENDTDYIGWAMEFLENLFTLPVRHIEKYKGTKLISRLLAKLKEEIEIANTSNKIESERKPLSAIPIAFGEDFESLDEADGMFIRYSLA